MGPLEKGDMYILYINYVTPEMRETEPEREEGWGVGGWMVFSLLNIWIRIIMVYCGGVVTCSLGKLYIHSSCEHYTSRLGFLFLLLLLYLFFFFSNISLDRLNAANTSQFKIWQFNRKKLIHHLSLLETINYWLIYHVARILGKVSVNKPKLQWVE